MTFETSDQSDEETWPDQKKTMTKARTMTMTKIFREQSVTFVKILIRMNVRIYSYQQNYTNEYPNIFILIF